MQLNAVEALLPQDEIHSVKPADTVKTKNFLNE
jgi:hypothetical protein